MTVMEEFEIKAHVFYRMTGYLAPGKDCRNHDPEVRRAAWDVWCKAYGEAVDIAMAVTEDRLPYSRDVP